MSEQSLNGSKWIKCDLHIHTPASFYHLYGDSQKEETWEKYIKDLENLPEEFQIVGINDYLTLEGYKKVLAYKSAGRLPKIHCILPVIEFRINKFAGVDKLKRINYHVIFSDEIDVDVIQTQFLNALSSKYTLESESAHPDWSAIPTDAALVELGQKLKKLSPGNSTLQNETDWQVGFNNFNIDYEHLKEILKRPQFANRVITAIGKGEWDDFRWNSGAAEKRTIINEADVVFLASASVKHYETAKNKLKADQVNDALLDCSDAHHYSGTSQKDKIGNCNTWLKIEPTFNGLRQILFEPDDRICVSETHPDQKAPYQIIDKIQFVEGGKYFTDAQIELSSGLNTIIGGKSTGKSLLAGLIVKASDPQEYARRKGDKVNELNWLKDKQPKLDFQVSWKDGGITALNNSGSEKRKITYFPQHYLNSQINDKGAGNKELNKIIRAILMQNKIYAEAFQKYESTIQTFDAKIASDASLFETKLRDFRGLQHTLKEKGKSADIQKNIKRLTKELSDLKSQYDLSEDELKKHQEISDELKVLNEEKEISTENASALESIEKNQITEALEASIILGETFDELSDELQADIDKQLESLNVGYADAVYKIILTTLKTQKDKAKNLEKKIKEKQKEHLPIINKINNSAPLHDKNKLIQAETTKLDEVKKLEARVENLSEEIGNVIGRLKNYLAEKIALTDLVKNTINEHPFSQEDDQLKIDIQHKCKAEHIQTLLKDRIKYQSNTSVKGFINDEEFNDTGLEGYANRIETILDQFRNNVLELKGDNKISSIIQEILSNAIYLNYDLKLSGDSFSIMSPGKRALALLRVLIELDQSQHPIVLDQPEDDLDNRSVYEGLAKYLKKKKTTRQIIVVTHNPNVVVGADSEYVIVANQSGQETNQDNRKFRFEYVYGGLENSFEEEGNPYILEKQGIREHVCEILDGGETAFERREKLYSGFKKIIKPNSAFAIAAE